ncbi:MAG: SMP-30/gluconolactonase/LRE family protein [Prosthecobacter sp.]|uniref:SMP-30/gluconolactonase/LRE family protein n=1 Tax=Prosthecobacter sp. TaxID=1965333 RepID=UPI0025FDEB43|nr:SMP-30/gluconolactonase/LRE family protein [Prosthecobacter sp.]MCF7787969.1 SMP-30/gluconolactonase/LRE family protein [Prosthecobacter sp.]
MSFRTLSNLALVLILASCSSQRSPVVPGAKPKDHGAIGATEGPAWKDGSLYFTDGKHINRLGPDGKTTVFRHNASNGLLFDKEGRLIACESGMRRVTRTEKDGSITVLADRFEGKRFNSPNDLCMDTKGRIYFTDPRYGSREGMEIKDLFFEPHLIWRGPMPDDLEKALADNPQNPRIDKLTTKTRRLIELQKITLFSNLPNPFIEGVYRIHAPGKVSQVLVGGEKIYRLERPNGILISPDDRYLYIADNNNNTHGGSRKILRYSLDKNGDVKPGTRKVLFDWKDGRGPDGMKMDSAGRIYVAAGTNKPTEFENTSFKAGCYILSPSGRLLDFIPVGPDECCNCAFGGKDGKTLFITSGSHLWSVPLR